MRSPAAVPSGSDSSSAFECNNDGDHRPFGMALTLPIAGDSTLRGLGRVLLKRQMSPARMIVVDVFA